MRPARLVQLALQKGVEQGALPTGVQVFTQRVADITAVAPCLVVTTAGGRFPDERFSRVASVVVDAYADEAADAEDLAETARTVLLAAATHGLGDVTTTSAPTLTPEPGRPVARCAAVYAVQLDTTPA